jgi:nucleoside-diphosphate-sugar epimerase
MKKRLIKLFTPERIFRGACDVILVNFSFILAFLTYVTWTLLITKNPQLDTLNLLKQNINYYLDSFVSLTLISLCVFSRCGFYTHSRTYQSRFKALVILQAISLSYLVFGFLIYVVDIHRSFPRSVILLGWCYTLFLVLLSRLWSTIWKKVASAEAKAQPHSDPKSILVIGGAGYIGSALLPKLLKEGYAVRLLDIFIYGDEPIKEFLTHPQLKVIRADFRQVDKVVEAIKGVGTVIHLGAIVGDPACSINEELTIDVNLMATRMIAEVCKGFGVERFIFASTCSVYGASDEILDEKSKLNPISLYAKTKIACERVLLQLADDQFNPVILRFSTIYGLSGRTRFDLVVNLLTAKACFDKKITLFDGEQWRPFLHVDDAANSILLSLKAPLESVNKQIFNVGSDTHNYTLAQVAEIIKQHAPEAEIVEMGKNADRRNYRVDFTKLQKTLNFNPKWTLKAGIEQVIEAITKGEVIHYGEEKFDNAKFLRNQGESILSHVTNNLTIKDMLNNVA